MHTRHTHFRWNHEARLCCFAGGGETPNADVPPAVEASERQDTVPPAAAETPESAADGAAKAAAERGAETLDKQIADTRKQVADLAKLVAILRREIPRQEQMRQEAQKSQAEAPSQASTSEVDEPTATPTEAIATPAPTEAASSDLSSSPPTGQDVAAPSAADRAREQLNRNLNENPIPQAEGSDVPIAPSTGEPAVAATEGELSSALASGEPLSDELFKKLQDTLIAREADLATAKANLETLKMQRPAPKTVGEGLERTMDDAMDECKAASEAIPPDTLALFKSGIKGLGALVQYLGGSLNGNNNKPLETAGANTPESGGESGGDSNKNNPHDSPLAERVQEEGASKVKSETVTKKEEAMKALNGDGTNPGLQKTKETLTQGKATLTTELDLLQRDLDTAKPDAPNRSRLEENLVQVKNNLQLIDTQLTQVEADIKRHNDTLISAANTLNEIDDLLKKTIENTDKLNTFSAQVLVAISSSDVKYLPEAQAIENMFSSMQFVAKDGQVQVLNINERSLGLAKEALGKLGIDSAPLNTRSVGADRFVEDPQAFVTLLEQLTGTMQGKTEERELRIAKMQEDGLDATTAVSLERLNAQYDNLHIGYENGVITLPPMETAGIDHIKSVLNILSANRAPGAIPKSISDVLSVRVKDALSNTNTPVGVEATKHLLLLFTTPNWHTEQVSSQLLQLKTDVPGVSIGVNSDLSGAFVGFTGDKEAVKNHSLYPTLDPLLKAQFSV